MSVEKCTIKEGKTYIKREFVDDNEIVSKLKPVAGQYNNVYAQYQILCVDPEKANKWTNYTRIITSVPSLGGKTEGWYEIDGEANSSELRSEPACYEIALKLSQTAKSELKCEDCFIPIYAGKSANARRRILSDYGRHGSHLHGYLRPYIEKGFEVYFRWTLCQQLALAEYFEEYLLSLYDYSACRTKNPPQRPAVWKSLSRVLSITDVPMVKVLYNLKEVRAQGEASEQGEPSSDDDDGDECEEEDARLNQVIFSIVQLSLKNKAKLKSKVNNLLDFSH